MKNKLLLYSLAFFLLIGCTSTNENSNDSSQENVPGDSNLEDRKEEIKYLSKGAIVNYESNAESIIRSTSYDSPFDTLIFDKVIAYDFDGIKSPSQSILSERGHLVPFIIKQHALSTKQTSSVLNSLTDKETYGGMRYACFEPHLAFVFYESSKIKMVVDVCLDCNYLIASTKIPATEANLVDLGDGTTYPRSGFSEMGVEKIIEICDELGMGYGNWKREEKKSR